MKKYWKFLSVWAVLVLFVNANALSYYGDYVGMAYIQILAEWWIALDVVLVLALAAYLLYHRHSGFNSVVGKLNLPSAANFLKPDRQKLLRFGVLVFATFVTGLLCTLIKSSTHEGFFAVSFWILAPEYAFPGWFTYDWVDTAFGLATLGMMLAKWLSLYVLSIFLTRKASA